MPVGTASTYTGRVDRLQLVATAVASASIALDLGLIDYETRSARHLFSAENAPFMLCVTAAACGLLACLQLAVTSGFRRRGRSK
jgi:H+/Cl- antiporter ClcA